MVRPLVRRFDIEVGHCSQCGRRVQGRHPLQTTDALGRGQRAARPGGAGLAVHLHTEPGVPLARVARLLRNAFGLHVTPGGLAHLLHRVARDAAPLYGLLCDQLRSSSLVVPDETGWRVGTVRHGLWVFTTPETTVYAICPGRSFHDATSVLGLGGRRYQPGLLPLWASGEHRDTLEDMGLFACWQQNGADSRQAWVGTRRSPQATNGGPGCVGFNCRLGRSAHSAGIRPPVEAVVPQAGPVVAEPSLAVAGCSLASRPAAGCRRPT